MRVSFFGVALGVLAINLSVKFFHVVGHMAFPNVVSDVTSVSFLVADANAIDAAPNSNAAEVQDSSHSAHHNSAESTSADHATGHSADAAPGDSIDVGATAGAKAAKKKGKNGEEPKKITDVINDESLNKMGMTNLMIDNLNADEFKVLKELSVRREALDTREKELELKESVLKATEAKLNDRMQELQNMQNKIDAALLEYQKTESVRIKSLVKIYENMKPQEAAKIFDELEMPVLLEVITNMKEVKVAPILANMNTAKAKEISVEFAKQKDFENKN